MGLRQRYYVDAEVQFPIIVCLILLVSVQGLFVGWGFSKAIAAAKAWDSPDQVLRFFAIVACTIIPVVGFNFLLGVWLSHKIAGPLVRVRQVAAEVARGNLDVEAAARKGDFLQSHLQDVDRMIGTLRRLIYRDRDYAEQANDLLTECQKSLAKAKGLSEESRVIAEKLLLNAKSKLSVVNTHFLKGRVEGTGEGA